MDGRTGPRLTWAVMMTRVQKVSTGIGGRGRESGWCGGWVKRSAGASDIRDELLLRDTQIRCGAAAVGASGAEACKLLDALKLARC